MGIRVSLEEEIEGLDLSEHGNSAYPDFANFSPVMQAVDAGNTINSGIIQVPKSDKVSPEVAIPVVNKTKSGSKISKITIIMNQNKFTELHTALDNIGITGLTVTNVLGHGVQKGHTQYYRGAPIDARLLPKIQLDIVVSKIPIDTLIDTIKNTLYTGNVGDGKIFIYDVENVIKVRTGEEGYDALQDE